MMHKHPSNSSLIALLVLLLIVALLSSCSPAQPVFSRWGPDNRSPLQNDSNSNSLQATMQPNPAASGARFGQRQASDGALAAFNAGSTLNESLAGGAIEYYTRFWPGGGRLDYVVAILDDQVDVRVITANGVRVGSDITGNTVWVDGGRHLQTVIDMAGSPHAVHGGTAPVAAMAFGFHGAERTSDEGSIVVDGFVQRLHPGRATLCIGPDDSATINLFDSRSIEQCEQAAGAGPMLLWRGKIANPDVQTETELYVPYNPLNEDFAQLGYRIESYRGFRPKTAIGVGMLEDGRSFLVLANAEQLNGQTMIRALRDMGCYDASGGDDGSSTQMVWRGQAVAGRVGRAVPSAVAIYVR